MNDFTDWLLQQAGRDGSIGNFARAVSADPDWPDECNELIGFEQYLVDVGAYLDSIIGLRLAWVEYQDAEAGLLPEPVYIEDMNSDSFIKAAPGRDDLDELGFCLLASRVSGGIWAICRDESARCLAPKGLLCYTFDEFEALLSGVASGKVTTIAGWLVNRIQGGT